MEQQFGLAGGRGRLTLRTEGPRAVVEAVLPNDGRGLYKAYLAGAGGRLLLGTLIPEGNRLRLCRTVSLDALRRQGVWPPEGAEAELAFPAGTDRPRWPKGWTGEPNPARRMGDPPLSRAAEGLHGALSRPEGEGFSLAVPWRADLPFPLVPAFCLARVEKLGGGLFAVFSFDGRGWPRV